MKLHAYVLDTRRNAIGQIACAPLYPGGDCLVRWHNVIFRPGEPIAHIWHTSNSYDYFIAIDEEEYALRLLGQLDGTSTIEW